jgi:hypothetical protein
MNQVRRISRLGAAAREGAMTLRHHCLKFMSFEPSRDPDDERNWVKFVN